MALPLGAGKRMSIQKDLMFELQAREDVACAFLVKCKFAKVCPIHEEVYGAGGEGEDLILLKAAHAQIGRSGKYGEGLRLLEWLKDVADALREHAHEHCSVCEHNDQNS